MAHVHNLPNTVRNPTMLESMGQKVQQEAEVFVCTSLHSPRGPTVMCYTNLNYDLRYTYYNHFSSQEILLHMCLLGYQKYVLELRSLIEDYLRHMPVQSMILPS